MYGLNTIGQQQFNVAVACAILSGVAVAIRVFSKIRHKQGVRSDDWWILIALSWYWASAAVVLWGM
jgi:RNA 3'-terminal phosphate cyclase